jgi:hypothetical protein
MLEALSVFALMVIAAIHIEIYVHHPKDVVHPKKIALLTKNVSNQANVYAHHHSFWT